MGRASAQDRSRARASRDAAVGGPVGVEGGGQRRDPDVLGQRGQDRVVPDPAGVGADGVHVGEATGGPPDGPGGWPRRRPAAGSPGPRQGSARRAGGRRGGGAGRGRRYRPAGMTWTPGDVIVLREVLDGRIRSARPLPGPRRRTRGPGRLPGPPVPGGLAPPGGRGPEPDAGPGLAAGRSRNGTGRAASSCCRPARPSPPCCSWTPTSGRPLGWKVDFLAPPRRHACRSRHARLGARPAGLRRSVDGHGQGRGRPGPAGAGRAPGRRRCRSGPGGPPARRGPAGRPRPSPSPGAGPPGARRPAGWRRWSCPRAGTGSPLPRRRPEPANARRPAPGSRPGPRPAAGRSASGTRLLDEAGRTFLDLDLAGGTLLHGHAHPRIAEAITRQAPLGLGPSAGRGLVGVLADRLADRFDPIEAVAWAGSGDEAWWRAVRAARRATGRRAVACWTAAPPLGGDGARRRRRPPSRRRRGGAGRTGRRRRGLGGGGRRPPGARPRCPRRRPSMAAVTAALPLHLGVGRPRRPGHRRRTAHAGRRPGRRLRTTRRARRPRRARPQPVRRPRRGRRRWRRRARAGGRRRLTGPVGRGERPDRPAAGASRRSATCTPCWRPPPWPRCNWPARRPWPRLASRAEWLRARSRRPRRGLGGAFPLPPAATPEQLAAHGLLVDGSGWGWLATVSGDDDVQTGRGRLRRAALTPTPWAFWSRPTPDRLSRARLVNVEDGPPPTAEVATAGTAERPGRAQGGRTDAGPGRTTDGPTERTL